MVVRDASLSKVLGTFGPDYHLNIVAANDIDVSISITLNEVPLEQALTSILAVANYTWVERNGIILVTSMTESAQLPADIQGRQIQVFDLDFARPLRPPKQSRRSSRRSAKCRSLRATPPTTAAPAR